MSTATLSGGPRDFNFRVDPNGISYGYQLNTSSQDTYAGSVVQILGTSITSLTINAEAGRGRSEYLKKVLLYCRDLVKWQKEKEKPVTFRFPSQGLVLDVFLRSFTLQDTANNPSYPYSLLFDVQEDVSGILLKDSLVEELERLKEGVGYDNESIYVDPEASENQVEELNYGSTDGQSGGSGGGTTNVPASQLGQAIINAGRKYLGTKYVWGGGGFNGPSNGGFDCSGFTQYAVYQGSGGKIKISRTAHTQQKDGQAVPRDQMAPGDLVMFTKKGSSRAHHVVIYLGDGKILHAPRTGDVVKEASISSFNNESWVIRRMVA